MSYAWKSGHNIKADANLCAVEMERLLAHYGYISAQALVEAGKDEESPLHSIFEWDDEKAAQAHRITEASHAMRSLVIVSDDASEPQPVFVSVLASAMGDPEARAFDHVYVSIGDARSSPNIAQSIREEALRGLRSWQRRYRMVQGLGQVHEAIERALVGLEEQEPAKT